MKICSKCRESKDFNEFNKCKTNRDGYEYYCRECKREYHRTLRKRCEIYTVVHNVKCRCNNQSYSGYKNYGGRGITYDYTFDSGYKVFWKHYGKLYRQAQKKYPNDLITIDRIDNEGNYEKGNIRFVPAKVNSNNKRNNKHLTYKGTTKTLSQWAEIKGWKVSLLCNRLKNKWPPELVLEIDPSCDQKTKKAITRYFKSISS